MLSRKHFKRFADILGKTNAKESTINEVENYFAEDNPRFDRMRFREAIRKRKELERVM